jgi:hypothetical protein
MRPRLLAAFTLGALMLSTACAAVGGPRFERDAGAVGAAANTASRPAPAAPQAAPAAQRAPAPGAPAEVSQATNLPGLDRMIIRTVSMTLSVPNVEEAYREVERIATEQGGLIAGSQIRQDGDRTVASVTLRVPADSATYQLTLERLRGLAEKVVDEQAQAQDITEEYVDLESRLRNLRASEESLLALLSRAQRIEDILAIQKELTNVRGQIEQIQGRKQALERRSDMATINLQIREATAFSRAGWNPGETTLEAVRALRQALQGVATFAIWVLVWTPLWGGALVLLWLLRRVWRPSLRLPRFRRTPRAGATPS